MEGSHGRGAEAVKPVTCQLTARPVSLTTFPKGGGGGRERRNENENKIKELVTGGEGKDFLAYLPRDVVGSGSGSGFRSVC